MFKLIFILIPVAIVASIIGMVVYSNQNQSTVIEPTPNPTPFVAQVNLLTSNTTIDDDNKHVASVDLSSTVGTKPTAFQIKLSYDPTQIHIEGLEEGTLWTENNVLLSQVDAGGGIIKYAVGQGFNAGLTSQSTLFKIHFTFLKQSSTPVFQVQPESRFGYLSESELVSLDPTDIVINIK